MAQSEDENLQIIDISSRQIELLNKYENEPIDRRNSILVDSMYTPHKKLWSGYLGEEADFVGWINSIVYPELPKYNLKAKEIDLNKLNTYFFETVSEMHDFTGYKPHGKWYVLFGPKWTNLGGFTDGSMFIDLAHDAIRSLSDIQIVFPHEINHQIYSNTLKEKGNAVLSRIIDEGFACYVSYVFHNGSTTISQELHYSELEYQTCVANEVEIIELLRKHYKSNDKQLSRNFASRDYKFSPNLPGAIGYYIGIRIIEGYVRTNGANSWKEVYELSPEVVLEQSKILD